MDSTDDDPTPSFSFRSTTQTATTLLRSHSTKEPPFSDFLHSPPRLLCPTLSRSLRASPLHHPHTTNTTKVSAHSCDEPQTTYHCASSVLRKDGQILSISLSNGLVYTGSDSNVIMVWKLPEFRVWAAQNQGLLAILSVQ
ncbi:hypothetical protein QN277_019536 [Acacia crassicarpa]|uniref:Uncharacterized protein n=1 Tax=Acacia crassicarpa TaxID=499986 RepID=A0AAE1JMI0_9FABA|nr:hypothetical protein QN277_019536 [Acacia crassicarpa]